MESRADVKLGDLYFGPVLFIEHEAEKRAVIGNFGQIAWYTPERSHEMLAVEATDAAEWEQSCYPSTDKAVSDHFGPSLSGSPHHGRYGLDGCDRMLSSHAD